MLQKIIEIRNLCDFAIKAINSNNKNIEKIAKYKEDIDELKHTIKVLKRENKTLKKDLYTMFEKIQKQKEKITKIKTKKIKTKKIEPKETYEIKKEKKPYRWDKDCVYYEKCRDKDNRLCHYCKENNTYIAK